MSDDSRYTPSQEQPHRPPQPRRTWERPALTAYGSFRKLTQGRSGTGGEGADTTMMSCL